MMKKQAVVCALLILVVAIPLEGCRSLKSQLREAYRTATLTGEERTWENDDVETYKTEYFKADATQEEIVCDFIRALYGRPKIAAFLKPKIIDVSITCKNDNILSTIMHKLHGMYTGDKPILELKIYKTYFWYKERGGNLNVPIKNFDLMLKQTYKGLHKGWINFDQYSKDIQHNALLDLYRSGRTQDLEQIRGTLSQAYRDAFIKRLGFHEYDAARQIADSPLVFPFEREKMLVTLETARDGGAVTDLDSMHRQHFGFVNLCKMDEEEMNAYLADAPDNLRENVLYEVKECNDYDKIFKLAEKLYSQKKYSMVISIFEKRSELGNDLFPRELLVMSKSHIMIGNKTKATEILDASCNTYMYYDAHFTALSINENCLAMELIDKAIESWTHSHTTYVMDWNRNANLEWMKSIRDRTLNRIRFGRYIHDYRQAITANGKTEYWSPNASDGEFDCDGMQSLPLSDSISEDHLEQDHIVVTSFDNPTEELAREIIHKYKSIPGGVTLEGIAHSFPQTSHVRYDSKKHAFVMDSRYTYAIPVARKEARAILGALSTNEYLGVSMGSSDIVYGDIAEQGTVAVDLFVADMFLGAITFAKMNHLQNFKLAKGYVPFKNKTEGLGNVCVYSNFSGYTFDVDKTGTIRLVSSTFDITLLPVADNVGPDGGHLPDYEKIRAKIVSNEYKKNAMHIIENFDYYKSEPILSVIHRYGEFAAVARLLKKKGHDLTDIAKQME